jgi:hypothetical protein
MKKSAEGQMVMPGLGHDSGRGLRAGQSDFIKWKKGLKGQLGTG